MCTIPKRVPPRSYVGRIVPERMACRLASVRRGGLIRTSLSLVIVARCLPCDAAVFHRHFHDGAAIELPDGGTIEFLPWCRAFRHGRQAVFLASRDFLVADQHVTAPRGEVDV